MKNWIFVSLILCSFGFFREMRPNEPFVTEFLSNDTWRPGINSDIVNRVIYPIGTFSYLILLCIVFLITDILRYKPIIVSSSLVGVALYALLLWTEPIWVLYLAQVLYGFYMAAEVAYFTYMYAKVEKEKYQKVTGNARASQQVGRFVASVMAQVLISTETMNVRELNYVTFSTQIISFFIAVFLPAVATSIYVWNDSDDSNSQQFDNDDFSIDARKVSVHPSDSSSENEKKLSWQRVEKAGKLLWSHFKAAYSDKTILTWSIWWALAMAGFLMIQTYVQLLWQEIDTDRDQFFNGGVESALTFFGAIGCLVAGFIPSQMFEKFDTWILTLCSLVEGAMIIVSAYTDDIWIAYIMYISFGTIYMFMITLASATVAKNLLEDSFALIFGVNTLGALIVQNILTVVFVTDIGLGLTQRHQFVVFGGYFVFLSAIFFIQSLVKTFRSMKQQIN